LLTGADPQSQQIDQDLASTPAFYRERIQAFRRIIRRQPTRQEKINRALTMVADQRSPYRKDAVRFLQEVNAVETAGRLAAEAKQSAAVRDEVVVALVSFKTKESIDYLIECLNDPSENVRSISIRGLQALTGQDFTYQYRDTDLARRPSLTRWQEWWKANRAEFKIVERSPEDQEEAKRVWEKYAVPYLE
jgi:hypothetical protein